MEQKRSQTAAQRYQTLSSARNIYLTRARDCAKLTIPYLMPPAGFTSSTKLSTPYQTMGARGIRTLSSKLLLSLFPTDPFFKYSVDDPSIRKIEAETGSQQGLRGEVEKALNSRERAIMEEVARSRFRRVAYTAFQHLLNSGNFVVFIPEESQPAKGFRLDQYVCKRSPDGTLLELIVEEKINHAALPEELRKKVEAKDKDKEKDGPSSDEPHIDLYTHIYLDDEKGQWVVYQEVGGEVVKGTEGIYKLGELPWLVLRLSAQPGEDYGRSYVEEYLGDLDSLEALSETLVEGAAAISRVITLVSPNGTTNPRAVAEAKTGDVLPGDVTDVNCIQANKGADLNVVKAQIDELKQDLAFAFMLNTAIQRKGERVTAEEIRYMASELDAALGGIYTLLGDDFQLPAVRIFERRMEKRTGVGPLPETVAKPEIVTGMEALGRGKDQQNMKLFLQDVVGTLGPEQALRFFNPLELLKRSAASYGIDTQGLIADEATLQQNDQMAQLQEMMKQLGPNAVTEVGRVMSTVMKNQTAVQGLPQGGGEAPTPQVNNG